MRPSGFVATNQRTFIDLAGGTFTANGCVLLRVIKDFATYRARTRANLSNTSMRRLGTKMGTAVRSNEFRAGKGGQTQILLESKCSYYESDLLCRAFARLRIHTPYGILL